MENCRLKNTNNTCKVTGITCHYTHLCEYVCKTYKDPETDEDKEKAVQEKALATLKSWLK